MYELAYDEHGEPFDVPVTVRGWKVARAANGPGRPRPVYRRNGGPLVIDKAATPAALLEVAGNGRYRLKPVDEFGREVPNVPIAWTGELVADDKEADEGDEDEDDGDDLSMSRVVCQLAKTVSRMGIAAVNRNEGIMREAANMMTVFPHYGVSKVQVSAAHARAHGIHLLGAPADYEDADGGDEEDECCPRCGRHEDSGELEGAVVVAPQPQPQPVAQLPDYVLQVIAQFSDSFARVVLEKIAGLGIPLEAFTDWRKAVPIARPVAPAPGTSSAPQAATSSSPGSPAAWAAPAEGFASTVAAPMHATPAAHTSPMHGAHVTPAAPPTAYAPPTPRAPMTPHASPMPPVPPIPPVQPVPPVASVSGPSATHRNTMPGSAVAPATRGEARPGGPPSAAHVEISHAGAAPTGLPVGAALAGSARETIVPGAPAGSLPTLAVSSAAPPPTEPQAGMGIWWSLSEHERELAQQLFMRLPDESKQQLVYELAALPPAEALARARALLHGPTTDPTSR